MAEREFIGQSLRLESDKRLLFANFCNLLDKKLIEWPFEPIFSKQLLKNAFFNVANSNPYQEVNEILITTFNHMFDLLRMKLDQGEITSERYQNLYKGMMRLKFYFTESGRKNFEIGDDLYSTGWAEGIN